MSALIDLIITQTDPVSAILLAGLWVETRRNRRRINRLEEGFIPDGGSPRGDA